MTRPCKSNLDPRSHETPGVEPAMSTGRTALVLAAMAITVSACGGQPEDSVGSPALSDSSRSVILKELDSYYADFSARNWERFSSHFWPGATITTIWQPPGADSERVAVTPVPEFVARAPEGPGSRQIFEERLLDAQMRISGRLAQVWARYRARFGDPGDVEEWEGIDAFTLMKQRGRWKIVSLVFASDE